MTRTINASDFYIRPGGELDRVSREREALVVLRRGVPLVRIEPVDRDGRLLSNNEEER